MPFVVKVLISALVIAAVSELGKRYTLVAAILASLPLTSVLAITWLYLDTRETEPIIELSGSIFWAVLPSLVFFIALPLLLRTGMHFWLALLLSITIMAVAYALYALLLRQFGIQV